MPPPSISRQAGDVLDEIIQFIRQEHDTFCSELCETDQKKLQRINKYLYAKLRAKFSENDDVLGSASNPTDEGTELSLKPGNLKPADAQNVRDYTPDIHEALNTPLETSSEREPKSDSSRPQRRAAPPPPSPREEAIARLFSRITAINPLSTTTSIPPQRQPLPREVARTQPLSEAAPTSPATASSTSSVPFQRRPPPAPPSPPEVARARLFSATTPASPGSTSGTSSMAPQEGSVPRSQRRVAGSRNSIISSETARGNQRITPQSRARSSTVIDSSSSTRSFVVSDPNLAREIGMMLSEVFGNLNLLQQVHGQQGRELSGNHPAKTNCVEIIGSDVEGLTVNNGGSNNSGAVIHKMSSSLPSQRVP